MTQASYQFALVRQDLPDGVFALCMDRFLSLGVENAAFYGIVMNGLRNSITAQIAVKMALDAALERALETTSAESDLPLASNVVRESFKEANSRVYQYGHRMGAGGSMGATGMIASYADSRFTMGRVGDYEGYLIRGGGFLPLFERAEKDIPKAGVRSRYIGANAQVLVDLASLEVLSGDLVAFTNLPLTNETSEVFREALDKSLPLTERATTAVKRVSALVGAADHQPILALLQIGRPTIVLREVVE